MMNIRSSADLRNQYKEISELARVSGEPVYITINGAGDGVFMSLEAFEQRRTAADEKQGVGCGERQAPWSKNYTQEELDERFKKRYED